MSQTPLPPLSPPAFLTATARHLRERRHDVLRIAVIPYFSIVLLQLTLPRSDLAEMLSGYRFTALVLLTVTMNLSFWNQCLRMATTGIRGQLIPPVGLAELQLFLRLLAVSVVVFLAASIPTQILLGLTGGINALLINAGIVILAFAYIFGRLLPWLSAPALGTKETIASSIAQTAAESRQIFAMAVVALAPFLIIAITLPLLGSSKIAVVLADRAATLALIAFLAFLQAQVYAYLRRRHLSREQEE